MSSIPDGRCKRCRRQLRADGKCPQDCERHARPSMRARSEDGAARRARREVVVDEQRIGLRTRDVVSPVVGNPDMLVSIDRFQRIASCPQCGSPTYRPATNALRGECADCGSVEPRRL